MVSRVAQGGGQDVQQGSVAQRSYGGAVLVRSGWFGTVAGQGQVDQQCAGQAGGGVGDEEPAQVPAAEDGGEEPGAHGARCERGAEQAERAHPVPLRHGLADDRLARGLVEVEAQPEQHRSGDRPGERGGGRDRRLGDGASAEPEHEGRAPADPVGQVSPGRPRGDRREPEGGADQPHGRQGRAVVGADQRGEKGQ